MGRLKIKKTLFVMLDKTKNGRLKSKTNLRKMLMTTLCIHIFNFLNAQFDTMSLMAIMSLTNIQPGLLLNCTIIRIFIFKHMKFLWIL
jgi:hypothetical protein